MDNETKSGHQSFETTLIYMISHMWTDASQTDEAVLQYLEVATASSLALVEDLSSVPKPQNLFQLKLGSSRTRLEEGFKVCP